MKSLEELKWEALDIQEVFPDIKRGRRLKTEDHIKGEMPYVSSSALNNGVDDYVSNKDRVRIFNDCLTIANSGSVGASFYHPYKFVASDHVTKLKNKDYNKYVYLFLATVTSRLSDKYSFNREINGNRINREKIYVPVDANGKPDFRFMEAYMRDLEQKILKPTIDKLCKQLIYNQMGGGYGIVTFSITNGKSSTLWIYLRYEKVSTTRSRHATKMATFHLLGLPTQTMESLVFPIMRPSMPIQKSVMDQMRA